MLSKSQHPSLFEDDIIYVDANERNRFDSLLDFIESPSREHKIMQRGEWKGYHDCIVTSQHHFKYRDIQKKYLDVGDYRFNSICIEYKTFNDLMHSVHGDRMDIQIDEAIKDSSISHYYVFCESNEHNQVPFDVRNYFYAKQSLKEVHFCIVDTEYEFFKTMLNLFRYSKSDAHIHSNNYRFTNKQEVTINPAVNGLLGLPSCTHNDTNKIYRSTMCFNYTEPLDLTLNELKNICGNVKGEKIYRELHKR